MPQHLDAFDARQYRQWLDRTVSNYTSVVKEAYGTPNPDQFWAVRTVDCDVKWSKKPGHFRSMIFSRIEFRDGKLAYIKNCWNPLAFLYAIGADVPIFRMDMTDPRVDAFLAQQPAPEEGAAEKPLDLSPEAIQKRIQDNLDAFRCGDYFDALTNKATFAPNHESHVWFLPPEMKEEYPPEMMERVEAWTSVSCPKIDFDESGVYFPTDDPQVYFCEYMCWGDVDWVGNNAPGGHYRNRYFYILRFDEAGRIRDCEEVLNPINKFNSIGVSIPSFPYYF
jgi:ketosteroid isomerase-like protein